MKNNIIQNILQNAVFKYSTILDLLKDNELEKWRKKNGIYVFYNNKTNMIYIGSSQNLYARIKQHLSYKTNKNLSIALKELSNFSIYILKIIDHEISQISLMNIEFDEYILKIPSENLYNTLKIKGVIGGENYIKFLKETYKGSHVWQT